MTVQEDGDGGDAIEISDEWWDKLTAMPFISRKYNKCFNSAVYSRYGNPGHDFGRTPLMTTDQR